MQPDGWQSGTVGELGEVPSDVLRVVRPAVLPTEDVAAVRVGLAPGGPLVGLACAGEGSQWWCRRARLSGPRCASAGLGHRAAGDRSMSKRRGRRHRLTSGHPARQMMKRFITVLHLAAQRLREEAR